MHTFLIVLQIILSVIIIISVMLQPSKSDGFNLISDSGSNSFYSKNKSRTQESLLKRITIISSIGFAIVTIALNLV